ncbi:transglycosylase domain-containing protein [Microbacterium sp. ASV49]|uniref:Transglycosylase domain-containing protein n=1 Tax=Microbacterium candidum TaxID=3041922 RepID=A0ABT7N2T0_9MICO|nr:transglycosylase domain-containing protein [Microbacterium sp. ASV49]MDL9981019.1 transglycosylase domain-containing protein [Microbacterium sp. ASV49]
MSGNIPTTRKRHFGGILGGIIGLVALSAVAGLLLAMTLTPAIATVSTATSTAVNAFDNLPSNLQISQLQLPTTIYTKNPDNGQWQEMTRFYDQNRVPVAWDQISPVMYDAILASEDPRYFQEGGVDLIGTARALVSNLKGQSNTQGGSSISQQYVKNILVQDCYTKVNNENLDQKKKDAALQACYTDATNSSGASGYTRKLQEMRYAIALSQKYSKNEVLLGYLNIANFGGTTYGIEAAAEHYFGVHASQLNLEQAATLAGMVQNPNTFRIDQPTNKTNGDANHYAQTKQREDYVLGRMKTLGRITDAQYAQAQKDPITPHVTPVVTGCASTAAPYYCAYVKSIITSDPAFGATQEDRDQALRQGGLNIYTTLDWRMQNAAQATVSQYAPQSEPGFGYGSVAVNIQPSTGNILSIAQNTTYSDTNTAPGYSSIVYAGDHVQGSTGFPAGSSFKLFTLLDWLEKGHTLNETVDGTVRIHHRLTNSCQGDWINFANTLVGNYSHEAGRIGTPLEFTTISLNSGYFGMAEKLDMCDVMHDASKLGVTQANGKDIDMHKSLLDVIGINPVSPIAMAGAYAALANNGVFCQPRVIERVTDPHGKDLPIPKKTCTQVVDPGVAATAIYAFQSVMQHGTGVSGNPFDGTPVFGKTGTNEGTQMWLIQTSTAMTSLVWSGVTFGSEKLDLYNIYYRGTALANIRFPMSKQLQTLADQLFPGGPLPPPVPALLNGAPPPPAATPAPNPGGGNGGANGGGGNGGGGGGGNQGGGGTIPNPNPSPTHKHH